MFTSLLVTVLSCCNAWSLQVRSLGLSPNRGPCLFRIIVNSFKINLVLFCVRLHIIQARCSIRVILLLDKLATSAKVWESCMEQIWLEKFWVGLFSVGSSLCSFRFLYLFGSLKLGESYSLHGYVPSSAFFFCSLLGWKVVPCLFALHWVEKLYLVSLLFLGLKTSYLE